METPCINVCSIDPDTRLCLGCRRTIEEISAWARLMPSQRRAIMASLADRGRAERPGAGG